MMINNYYQSSSSSSGSSTPTILEEPDPKPLILRVHVICGRNLAAKDRSGTSDPYLVLALGDARESTPTIPKTLNPDWNFCCELPVLGVPLLECVCWDKDRIGRDYMGEFDIALEDLFADGQVTQEPKWYTLHSKLRNGRKKHTAVSGQIQLQFSLYDSADPDASPEQIYQRFKAVVRAGDGEPSEETAATPAELAEAAKDGDTSEETDLQQVKTADVAEKQRRRLRLARLRRKSIAARAYEFSGSKDGVSGIVFMEVNRVTDLPPEKNMTRTSFDMDPFVVTSLGRKTLRTRVIRHNLNPVYDEKMVFQVRKHEQSYSFHFSVVDRDKLSGNDFVASANFPLQTLILNAPRADPETGLYQLPGFSDAPRQPPTPPPTASRSRFRLPLSRSTSASSLSKFGRPPPLRSKSSATSLSSQSTLQLQEPPPPGPPATTLPAEPSAASQQLSVPGTGPAAAAAEPPSPPADSTSAPDDGFRTYVIPLTLKNKERWEDKHFPELHIRAKYMPYAALRQQFWRLMLKQYDADDSGRISKVELVTMLDTLGSTLKESTIDEYFRRFAAQNEPGEPADLTFDQAVICLEETLQSLQRKSVGTRLKDLVLQPSQSSTSSSSPPAESSITPSSSSEETGTPGAEAPLDPDDLADGRDEEHVVEISECPLCHQPRLAKRSDADIITHIATCASQDWRQVDNLVMGGFVTSSQAQRKWYSKVITKISYGGYKLGANSANILVQDRITGQITEERMSVYVRLGIRLLYKGLKSREMERKKIRRMLKALSIKQGKKYDDPASASQIPGFIAFHNLDMSEVLLPLEEFKTFNEFFYRALKPGSRPCSAPDNPDIIVSPADCRTVVFDRIDDATKIWVKGREFSIERLLGKAYPEDVARYRNGSLGIFRLAPQDYHRFHIPVDGVLGTPKLIEGEYYTVNPMAIRSALDVYGENVRVLVPIESVCHGRVMLICVGAMMVGSTVITRQAGEKVTRGEELGYFKFGGSTVLMLCEPGRMRYDQDLVDNSKSALETLIRVGMSVGHSPHVPPYAPDMPKPAGTATTEEKMEANRKISGQTASIPSLQVTSPR
ncbi:hypothetical protein VTO42DRAFT_4705 [Malbranchea cinnamomea]